MSRHRNIRNLSADDYEDDFGDDDDFGGYGGAHGNPGFSDADLRRSVSQLRAIVGNAVPAHELEETLMYYSLDVPKSVTWLLDGVDPDAGAAPVSVPATATRPKGTPLFFPFAE
ncbi:hypothetical protein BC828DRAFT_303027 [Blastocladiella britannica]|nr:hypothetical protein BC828DRAFT_303027 [Blastocladiella britannica]